MTHPPFLDTPVDDPPKVWAAKRPLRKLFGFVTSSFQRRWSWPLGEEHGSWGGPWWTDTS